MKLKMIVHSRWSIVHSVLIAAALFSIFAVNCYAVTWSSNELIEKSKELNGRKLNYRGELVTTILNRGEYSWVNLNDGINAIGVWCKSSQLEMVRFAGDYKKKGDVLEVSGKFHRACQVHNGELDIHADTVKIIKNGYIVKEIIDFERIKSFAILFFVTILTIIFFRRRL
jgi:hypothetical protein